MLKTPEKMPSSGEPLLGIFSDDVGNLFRLQSISVHLRCQKDAGFLAARKCMCGFVSLQLFSSHLNQSEPHSNHVNRRKIITPAPNCPSSSTTKRTCLLLCRIKWLLVPRLGKAERLSPSLRQKDRNVSPEPNVDTNSVQGFFRLHFLW